MATRVRTTAAVEGGCRGPGNPRCHAFNKGEARKGADWGSLGFRFGDPSLLGNGTASAPLQGASALGGRSARGRPFVYLGAARTVRNRFASLMACSAFSLATLSETASARFLPPT